MFVVVFSRNWRGPAADGGRGGPLLGDPGMPSRFWFPGKLALFDKV